MNDHTPDSVSKPKSRPRLFRWSLRYFLIFFTLVSISSGCWITRAQQQRAAVAKIQELGGDVEYSSSFSAGWLGDLVGVDYVQAVTKVQFSGIYKNMESFDIEKVSVAVKQLSSCRSLSIGLRRVTDAQLSELQRLSGQLEEISLHEAGSGHLSAAGIKAFKNWPRLKSLSYSCSSGDPDFSSLSTCPQLETVYFGHFHLSREDFQNLARCTNLKHIAISSCTFEGESLSELNTPALKLETLSLTNCRPEQFVRSWTVNKAGEKINLAPTTFNFRGGDPQFYTAPIPGDVEFPTEEYERWKKEILPGVNMWEMFMS